MPTTIRVGNKAKSTKSTKVTAAAKATTIRAGRQDRVRAGAPAKAGKTKSVLDVMESTGIRKKATTIRAGSRVSRARGGGNPFSRANSSANSLSH